MPDVNETRRRFVTHFASIGLGTTLAPGIVWTRMQDAGTQKITLEMITEALRLSGLEFTEGERKAMVDSARTRLPFTLSAAPSLRRPAQLEEVLNM